MDEPLYRVWMQDSVDPKPYYEERPGRWVAETAWPSPRIEHQRLFLNPGRLDPAPSQPAKLAFSSPQTTGLTAGEWCAFGAEGEMPLEQRPDDGRSLTFETAALAERVEILGAPVVELDLAADEPQALLAVRLNDVQPDGTSTLVTYGLLNLTHRDGHAQPAPLEPGTFYRIRLQLNDIAHAFPAGHRVRIALSSSYWPIAWPSPDAAILTVQTGKSALYLPVRPPAPDDHWLRPFEPPAAAPGLRHRRLREMPLRRTIELDLATNQTVYTFQSGDFGAELAHIEPIAMDLGYTFLKRHRISEYDPLSAHTEVVQTTVMRRTDWAVRIECRTRLSATRTAFQFSADLKAFEGDLPVRAARMAGRDPAPAGVSLLALCHDGGCPTWIVPAGSGGHQHAQDRHVPRSQSAVRQDAARSRGGRGDRGHAARGTGRPHRARARGRRAPAHAGAGSGARSIDGAAPQGLGPGRGRLRSRRAL